MQFTLQRRTDLALQALEVLAAAGGRLSGPGLANAIGTSTSYLPQVMAPLARAGWTHSERGPGGGYALDVELDGLSLLEVIESIEGPIADGLCVLGGGPCPGSDECALHKTWTRIRSGVIDELGATTVSNATEERQS